MGLQGDQVEGLPHNRQVIQDWAEYQPSRTQAERELLQHQGLDYKNQWKATLCCIFKNDHWQYNLWPSLPRGMCHLAPLRSRKTSVSSDEMVGVLGNQPTQLIVSLLTMVPSNSMSTLQLPSNNLHVLDILSTNRGLLYCLTYIWKRDLH